MNIKILQKIIYITISHNGSKVNSHYQDSPSCHPLLGPHQYVQLNYVSIFVKLSLTMPTISTVPVWLSTDHPWQFRVSVYQNLKITRSQAIMVAICQGLKVSKNLYWGGNLKLLECVTLKRFSWNSCLLRNNWPLKHGINHLMAIVDQTMGQKQMLKLNMKQIVANPQPHDPFQGSHPSG